MLHNQEGALRTVKNLRKELRIWGNYYVKYEMGSGYPSRSACDRLQEAVIRSVGSVEPELSAPPAIYATDLMVKKLSFNCRKAVRVQYLCSGNWAQFYDSKKTFTFWLKRAEIALLGE